MVSAVGCPRKLKCRRRPVKNGVPHSVAHAAEPYPAKTAQWITACLVTGFAKRRVALYCDPAAQRFAARHIGRSAAAAQEFWNQPSLSKKLHDLLGIPLMAQDRRMKPVLHQFGSPALFYSASLHEG